MSDQELRDKLASEWWHQFQTGIPVTIHAVSIFKAGWDAARENENRIILKPETGGTYTVTAKLTTSAEVERDQLKAQCEKLAEALDDILMAVPSLSAVLKIARENLAEYRKANKC